MQDDGHYGLVPGHATLAGPSTQEVPCTGQHLHSLEGSLPQWEHTRLQDCLFQTGNKGQKVTAEGLPSPDSAGGAASIRPLGNTIPSRCWSGTGGG